MTRIGNDFASSTAFLNVATVSVDVIATVVFKLLKPGVIHE
jgi:hypothetical protein